MLKGFFSFSKAGGLQQHDLMERTLTLEPEWPELESWLYSFLSSYQTDLSQFLQNKMGTTVSTLSGSYAQSMIGQLISVPANMY